MSLSVVGMAKSNVTVLNNTTNLTFYTDIARGFTSLSRAVARLQ